MVYELFPSDHDIMRCYNISYARYYYSLYLQETYELKSRLDKYDWGIITICKNVSIEDYIRQKGAYEVDNENMHDIPLDYIIMALEDNVRLKTT